MVFLRDSKVFLLVISMGNWDDAMFNGRSTESPKIQTSQDPTNPTAWSKKKKIITQVHGGSSHLGGGS